MPSGSASTPPSFGHAPATRSATGTRSVAPSASASSQPLLLGREVSRGEPAVHHEGRGGHVGRLVARQEEGSLGDLAYLGEAPHRQVDETALRLLGIARE